MTTWYNLELACAMHQSVFKLRKDIWGRRSMFFKSAPIGYPHMDAIDDIDIYCSVGLQTLKSSILAVQSDNLFNHKKSR